MWNVSWHPQGNILTSCGEDKVICLWGTEGGAEGKWVVKTNLTDGHERTIRDVSDCGMVSLFTVSLRHISVERFKYFIIISDQVVSMWELSCVFKL